MNRCAYIHSDKRMEEKLESSSEIYALAHTVFLEYSLARFTPCVFTDITLYKVRALTVVAMPIKVTGVTAALFKQHMLHEGQGRQIGLSKCDGKLETVVTYPPQEHLGSVAVL